MKDLSDSLFHAHPSFDESTISTTPYLFEEICTKDGYLMPDTYLLTRADYLTELYGMSNATDFLNAVQKAFSKPSSPLAELRKKVSDEELLRVIKRRNIQTPAEMEKWLDHLDVQQIVEASNLLSKKLSEEEKKKKEDFSKNEPSEPKQQAVPSPAPSPSSAGGASK